MLAERIAAFIRGGSPDSFDSLALAGFALAYGSDERYRERCRRHGATPDTIAGWRQIPPVAAVEPAGMRGPELSDPDAAELDTLVVDRSLSEAVPEAAGRPPVLSLVPPGPQADAGLAALATRVLERWAAADSRVAASRRGVEVAQARSFLAARQRDRRPPLILAPAAALGQLADGLERRGLRFRLPPASLAVALHGADDGGAEPRPDELAERLGATLALAGDSLVHAYRGAGTASRFYARQGAAGPEPYRPWPWTRVRVLDPGSQSEALLGTAGALAILDLAAGAAPLPVLGGETGIGEVDGFRVVGRG